MDKKLEKGRERLSRLAEVFAHSVNAVTAFQEAIPLEELTLDEIRVVSGGMRDTVRKMLRLNETLIKVAKNNIEESKKPKIILPEGVMV